MDGVANTPGGAMKTHTEGQWAVNGDRMLFKYNDAVVPYSYKKEGNKLTLSLTGSLKRDTVLVKQ